MLLSTAKIPARVVSRLFGGFVTPMSACSIFAATCCKLTDAACVFTSSKAATAVSSTLPSDISSASVCITCSGFVVFKIAEETRSNCVFAFVFVEASVGSRSSSETPAPKSRLNSSLTLVSASAFAVFMSVPAAIFAMMLFAAIFVSTLMFTLALEPAITFETAEIAFEAGKVI